MSGQTIGAGAQVKSLAKAVSTAFAASNLTDEEKRPGKIEITDLPWAAPPLITPLTLAGGALQDYFDVPLNIDVDNMLRFWHETLQAMWNTPGRLMRNGGYATCGKGMPKVKAGQRAFRFSVPIGYPSLLDESAGVMFSLELAHTVLTSAPVVNVQYDDSNYIVQTACGNLFGVKNGRPLIESPWRMNVSGAVPDMMETLRGDTNYTCRYDEIALLRSILHVHRKSFPRNFEALDLALQALRLLTLGGACPALITAMHVQPMNVAVVRERERALSDAIELIDAPMSDRQKLQTLYSLLVPAAVSRMTFRSCVFSGSNFPYTLAAGKLENIATWLRSYYQAQIPAEMRRLKLGE